MTTRKRIDDSSDDKMAITLPKYQNLPIETPKMIVLPVDRGLSTIQKYISMIGKAQAWQTPLGIFLAILFTLVTTDFKDALGFERNVWTAFALMVLCVTFIWLAWSLFVAWKSRGISADKIMDELRGNYEVEKDEEN